MAAYTEREILDAFDAAQETYVDWAEFGNLNYDVLSARLIACRDEERWALIFNTIEWRSGEGMDSRVLPVGNCVSVPLAVEAPYPDDAYYLRQVESTRRQQEEFESSPGAELLRSLGINWREMQVSDEELLAQFKKNHKQGLEFDAKDLGLIEVDFRYDRNSKDWGGITRFTIRGESIPFRELKVQQNPKLRSDPAFWVAVAATEAYRERMLATDEEIARFFNNDLPPKLVVLDDWCHGDFERPSHSQTFRMLAKALVTGDASVYRPTAKPNTHWRNWIPK